LKRLMLGNEAIARGAYEAGCSVVSSYPGTPSTEITEYVSKYDEIYSEWAPNEKVALEVAVGASVAGGRAMSAMKHVGLNVAADPLFTASYTGVNGGLVVCVADDQGMHSSQNEQDSRNYAKASKIPMLEPSDSGECKDFVKTAFELSEQFDTPVLIRLSTRIAHSQSIVEECERKNVGCKEYVKNPGKFVMMPAMAKVRHPIVEERMLKLTTFGETSDINKIEYNDKKIGVIAAGIAYQYAKEALGDKASYLKLGMIHPLPDALIKEFAKNVDVCYVIEELDPFVEDYCKKMGIEVTGKDKLTMLGEYGENLLKKVVLNENKDVFKIDEKLPARPPVMCAGCPHRAVFYALKQLKFKVSGDIGCYTLSALPPLQTMDACLCMGGSVSMAHGMEKAGGREFSRNTVAVIGDSTFIHSGITGLIDIVYNKGASTVMILDNSTTGMTGHQNNPANGFTIKNDPTSSVDLVKLCEAVGVKRITVIDPFDSGLKDLINREAEADEPSVIITRRPCALLKTVKNGPAHFVDQDKCKKCGVCAKIGCPAITFRVTEGGAVISKEQCTGCSYCASLCKFNAIVTGKEGDR